MLLPMSYVAQDAQQQDSLFGLPSAFGVAPGCLLAGCPPAPAYSPDSPQLSATVDGTNVTLTWNVPNDGGAQISKYILDGLISTPRGQHWIKITDISPNVRNAVLACNESLSCSVTTSTGTGNTITAQITGLPTNQSYAFKVFAKNYVGASGSNAAWITTELPAAPDPPRNLAASIMDSKITLTWDAPSRTGGSPITEYVIASRIGATNPFSVVKTVSSSETSATVDTTNGMPYQFVAYAKNNVSTSEASNMTEAVSISPPSSPTGLKVEVQPSSFVLSWTAPPSDAAAPVSEYLIKSTYEQLGSTTTEEVTISADATTYTLNRFTHANYVIEVHAVNAIGTSQPETYHYTSMSGPE